MHKTLLRQIKRYLGNEENVPAECRALLEAVSKTYEDFDNDRKLIEHSLEVSSKELGENIALLQAVLNSTINGILAVDENDRVVMYNKRYLELWDVPEPVINTRDVKKVLVHVHDKLADPEYFAKKVKELSENPIQDIDEMLPFKNGMVIRCFSKPDVVDGKYKGRVWSFNDVTDLRKNEEEAKEQLGELERLNKYMVDRELKMIELKETIEHLQEGAENATKAVTA